MDVAVGALALIGAALVVLAGIGVLRFPDLYSRMHAATKVSTLAFALVALAGVLAIDADRSKVVLAAIFIFITAPSAAHLVGRAAYRAEGIEMRLDARDDLATLMGERTDDGDASDT